MATWKTIIVSVLAGGIGAAPCASGQPTARLTLDVLPDPGIPATAVATASAVVDRLYRGIGLEVVWAVEAGMESMPDASTTVWRRIAIRSSAGKEFPAAFGNTKVLGVAPRGQGAPGRVGYVFYDAARAKALRHELPIGVLLGYAMAHELAHLLLPRESHSDAGVMRLQWRGADLRQIRLQALRFDPRDGSQICEALRSVVK